MALSSQGPACVASTQAPEHCLTDGLKREPSTAQEGRSLSQDRGHRRHQEGLTCELGHTALGEFDFRKGREENARLSAQKQGYFIRQCVLGKQRSLVAESVCTHVVYEWCV